MRNTTKVGSCCGHDCTPLSGLFGVTCAGTIPSGARTVPNLETAGKILFRWSEEIRKPSSDQGLGGKIRMSLKLEHPESGMSAILRTLRFRGQVTLHRGRCYVTLPMRRRAGRSSESVVEE